MKLSADPNGMSWRNHSGSLAEKMMSNMGWADGRGLGKDLQGRTEIVKNSLKQDKKGLGCSAKRAIEGSVHIDDFDLLLSKLNESHQNSSNASTSKSMSLTEKSKSTSCRLHYAKFVKGKDVSRYSSNELACIFSKSTNPAPMKEEVTIQSESIPDFGVNTTRSTLSMNDYFKMKMKTKLGDSCENNKSLPEEIVADIDSSQSQDVLDKKSKKDKHPGGLYSSIQFVYEQSSNEITELVDRSSEFSYKKERHFNSSTANIESTNPNSTKSVDDKPLNIHSEIFTKRAKKKSKKARDSNFNEILVERVDHVEDKQNLIDASAVEILDKLTVPNSNLVIGSKREKKKTKKRHLSSTLETDVVCSKYEQEELNDEKHDNKKKKKKRSKLNPTIEVETDNLETRDLSISINSTNSKSKPSQAEITVFSPTINDNITLTKDLKNSDSFQSSECVNQLKTPITQIKEVGLNVSDNMYDERKQTHGVDSFPSSNYFCIEGYSYY